LLGVLFLVAVIILRRKHKNKVFLVKQSYFNFSGLVNLNATQEPVTEYC
jgi:hypothetical protein